MENYIIPGILGFIIGLLLSFAPEIIEKIKSIFNKKEN